jgi:hypothetical protein
MDTPWYHSKDKLEKALAEHGTWAATSRATQVPVTTLKNWGDRLEIKTGGSFALGKTGSDAALLQENRDLRARARKLEEGATQDERVLRRLEAAIEGNRPRFEPAPFKQARSNRTPQELFLGWSDLHASEVVTLEGTRGMNEYSWDIMLDRMQQTQETVFSHAEHFGFAISRMVLGMLGDMLSGDIHEELAITNDRPTVDAVVDLAYDHAPWISRFADRFGAVHVVAIPGNHPRFAKKPSAKQYYNNADWLFYKLLEALLKDDSRITFDIPRSSMAVTMLCERWRMLMMHGDGIRTTMPGVPWGGVHRRVTTLEAQFTVARQPLDYVSFGHWHTQNSLDGIQAKTFMNGSVKGLDEYSLQRFGSGRSASQLIQTYHPDRGWTGTYACDLQDVIPASEGW